MIGALLLGAIEGGMLLMSRVDAPDYMTEVKEEEEMESDFVLDMERKQAAYDDYVMRHKKAPPSEWMEEVWGAEE